MFKNNNSSRKNKIRVSILFVVVFVVLLVFLIVQVSCCFDFSMTEQAGSVSETVTESTAFLETETAETIAEESTPLETPELHLISRLKIPGQAIDVKAEGGYAYLTNDLGILFVIDVRDKEEPFITGKCPNIDAANIVIIQDDYAYISYTSWISPEESGQDLQDDTEEVIADIYSISGFKIVDITDKKNPRVIGDYVSGQDKKKSVQGLFIEGDYAYLNTTLIFPDHNESMLEVVDIRDKKNPVLIGGLSIDGQPNGLFVEGNFAYLNNIYFDFQKKDYSGESRFFVIDIEDRKKPEITGSCEVPANSWSVYVKGNRAYLSSSDFDTEFQDYTDSIIQVVDISDPGDPAALGSCSITGGAWEIDAKDDFLLISSNEGGISAVDISEGMDPEVVSYLNTCGNSYDIAISGDYGYIADGFQGLAIIGLQKKEIGEGMIVEEPEKGSNSAPIADIEVFGDEIKEGFYIEENPVFLSAIDSYDPDDDDIDFKWEIEGNEIVDNISAASSGYILYEDYGIDSVISEDGDEIICFFENPGDYRINLTVDDGALSDTEEINITIARQELVIDTIKEHNFDVEIECTLLNRSDIYLKDLECYLRTPQTYYPYQVINGIGSSIENVDEVFDDSRNLLTHFVFDESLKIGKDREFKASITSNVTMYEYDFKNIDTKGLDYAADDRDLKYYTGEDIFIDVNDPLIKKAAREAVGNETDPVSKAKRIYNYVTSKLYYDFPRAGERHYEFMDASEILETGKGVCADYAILYTALLRAAGIPSRIVAGIPVMLILGQDNKELDIGHAWVEAKLPGYGWIPIDITQEEGFMNVDYFLNLSTEKGTSFLYERLTMDWGSYFFDGFQYEWDGNQTPDVEQNLLFRIENLDLSDIRTLYN